MRRTGWRDGIEDLARNVLRVLLVYALVLQALAPLAVARAEARSDLGGHLVLCSAMVDAAQPGKTSARIVHDCLACCFGSGVAALARPAELPEPARFFLWVAPAAPAAFGWLDLAGGPPPQRAPPRLG